MPDVPPLEIAKGRITADFLGKVVGLHGVATALYNNQPAVALLGITRRPPADAAIPGALNVIVDGVRHTFPLVWIQTSPKQGAIVCTGNEVVSHG